MADHDPAGVRQPPTVIVVHPRERRSKCTVESLRGRDDFVFVRFPESASVALDGYVRLGLDGPPLSAADAGSGLLVLDGTWKLAGRMEPFYADLPVRSLPDVSTAYPRVSRLYEDPTDGLATIEAVYVAFRLMHRSVHGLLDHYHWRNEFLRMNGWSDEHDTAVSRP